MNSLEVSMAARTVWGEARGEGPDGMTAVANVLLNRVVDGRWGKTMFDVCTAAFQFSTWNKGDPNRVLMINLADFDPYLQQCTVAVQGVLSGTAADPTKGAMWYFADTIAPPYWSIGATQTAHIGHHIFFRNIK